MQGKKVEKGSFLGDMKGEQDDEFFLPHMENLINKAWPPTECFFLKRNNHAKEVHGHEERSPYSQEHLHVELTRIAEFGEVYTEMVHRLRSKSKI